MARRNAGRSRRKNFGVAPGPKIGRSAMDRSFSHRTAIDEGLVVPVLLDEILPGDTVNIKPSIFVRMATPLHPILDTLFVDFHLFFVPNRLVWKHWVNLMGEEVTPDDTTTYTVPTAEVPQGTRNQLPDYYGIPPVNYTMQVNALPFRGYDLIWDEWYRDANIQSRVFNDRVGGTEPRTGDGPDSLITTVTIHPRGKRKDYFTSAMPWPQAGDPVELPLGETSVVPGGDGMPLFDVHEITAVPLVANAQDSLSGGGSAGGVKNDIGSGGLDWELTWNDPALSVQATSTTINAMREAFQVQKLLERDARGGRRYTELILSHFGVRHPDQSWRPEFLGSMSFPVGIFQVPQTSESGTTPQGTLTAYAVGHADGRSISRSFTEHGFIHGFISIRSDLMYQQGLNKMWSRSTRYDFYWPAFAHLGEQQILNQELYLNPTVNTGNTGVFGYQERFGEMRYMENITSGDMRSSSSVSLDTWHLAQDFSSLPVLADEFIKEQPPVDRVIAVTNQKHFLVDAHFKYNHVRPMPMFGIPGMIDHF